MITRRQFLKTAAGAAASLAIIKTASLLSVFSDHSEREWIGPKVRDGLSFREEPDRILVLCDKETEPVMITNQSGRKLLSLADGSRSLDELIRLEQDGRNGEAVADFFLALGQAGWLDNRLEVIKYAVES